MSDEAVKIEETRTYATGEDGEAVEEPAEGDGDTLAEGEEGKGEAAPATDSE